MASYNPGRYLRAAIASVLAQTYDHFELILIDDGSTDSSLQEVEDLLDDKRVRLVRQENTGKPRALNKALELARGEFYAIQDADDVSYPTRLQRQAEKLMAEPDLAAVMSGNDLIIDDNVIAPTARSKDRERCRQDIEAFTMPALDPTAMYRCSMVADLRYAPNMLLCEAYDYILHIGERSPIVVLGECLYSYRIHATSITKRDPGKRQEMVEEALRRACLRRGLDYHKVFGPEQQPRRRPRNRDIDNNLAAHFMESAVDLRAEGRMQDAVRTGLYCARLHATDPYYYKALAYAVLPPSIVTRLRAHRRGRVGQVAIGT